MGRWKLCSMQTTVMPREWVIGIGVSLLDSWEFDIHRELVYILQDHLHLVAKSCFNSSKQSEHLGWQVGWAMLDMFGWRRCWKLDNASV